MIYIFLLLVLYYWIISESSIKYNVYSAIYYCIFENLFKKAENSFLKIFFIIVFSPYLLVTIVLLFKSVMLQ